MKPSIEIPSYKLSNGLEIFPIQKHSIPMVTILIAVKNGSFAETEANNGLAHLYEHMFFKANEKVPSQPDFLHALEEMGIELGPNMNAYTSTESVRYFFTIQSQYLKPGIQFMADALMTPKFLQDELEKERKVVIGEFDRYEASPNDVFFQKSVFGRLFKKYWVRKNVIGDRSVILKASQEQMHEIQHRYYIPNNAALFIVGDFDEAQLKAAIDESFGKWSQGDNPFEKYPVPDHPPLEKTEAFVEFGPVQNVNIVWAQHGPSMTLNDRELIALDLASMMLGLEASPMQQELVQTGIATHASMFAWSQRYVSPLMFNLETTPENSTKAYEIMTKLRDRIMAGGFFSEKELQTAKTSNEVSSAYDREVGQKFALSLASIWTSTGKLDFYTSYIDTMKTITLSDIDAALKKYLSRPYILGALMPAGSKPPAFKEMSSEKKP